MDLINRQYDEAIHNIIKVYLAQMNSAMKISKVIYEHSDKEINPKFYYSIKSFLRIYFYNFTLTQFI